VTESLGTRLRRERERRRISIKSIAETTNIRAALFEQLERDDASKWPSGIFRRSFIRAYASAIGLDPESTVREFLAAFPDPAQTPAKTVAKATSEVSAPRAPELRLHLAAGDVAPRHWHAAFCDLVALAAVALASAIVFRQVWMPLAICTCAYYAAGTVLTGASPGIFFLAWYRRLGQATAKAVPAATRSAAPFLIHPDRGHSLSLELSAESGAVSNQ
jgi:transcriptional regulator with XRE-family HTH domain